MKVSDRRTLWYILSVERQTGLPKSPKTIIPTRVECLHTLDGDAKIWGVPFAAATESTALYRIARSYGDVLNKFASLLRMGLRP